MVEVLPLEGSYELGGGLHGDRLMVVFRASVWSEGVGPSHQHLLGKVGGLGEGGDTKVSQHGVGLPATEELDDVGVDVGAEEGSGAARTQAASAEEGGRDARGILELRGGGAKRGGDMFGGHALALASRVVVVVDSCAGRGAMGAEVCADACQCFAWAEYWVEVGGMGDLFAFDGVLLVSKREGSPLDAVHVDVIQRGVSGVVDFAVDLEGGVAELEGFGAALALAGEVLGGAEEPVEADNAEQGDMLRVCSWRLNGGEVAHNGDVGGVRSALRVVFAFQGLEIIIE